MSRKSKEEFLQSLAGELAENLKTEKDLSDLTRELVKLTVETALGREMEEHLGLCETCRRRTRHRQQSQRNE